MPLAFSVLARRRCLVVFCTSFSPSRKTLSLRPSRSSRCCTGQLSVIPQSETAFALPRPRKMPLACHTHTAYTNPENPSLVRWRVVFRSIIISPSGSASILLLHRNPVARSLHVQMISVEQPAIIPANSVSLATASAIPSILQLLPRQPPVFHYPPFRFQQQQVNGTANERLALVLAVNPSREHGSTDRPATHYSSQSFCTHHLCRVSALAIYLNFGFIFQTCVYLLRGLVFLPNSSGSSMRSGSSCADSPGCRADSGSV